MIRLSQIKIQHDKVALCDEDGLLSLLIKKSATLLKITPEKIAECSIRRHSVDARKKPDIFDVYTVDVCLKNSDEQRVVQKAHSNNIQEKKEMKYQPPRISSDKNRSFAVQSKSVPVVVGSGPAGLFCAYVLAGAGLKPILLERGRTVEERKKNVSEFWATGNLNEESNVQFGEGGAGTFSDGKLYTGTNDRDGRQRYVMETFVRHGANRNILYEAAPHIGTDCLESVVVGIREEIRALGGEILFSTKMTDLKIENGALINIEMLDLSSETSAVIPTDTLVLAIGHSARDTFRMLENKGLIMEKKPFAVGLRVAHPQELIDLAMYGKTASRTLPPSPYKLTAKAYDGRGVYSFCMCPGGYIVNASSEQGYTCVNGMSYSGRDAIYANSAIVVTVTPNDFGSDELLAGCVFQRDLEQKAFRAGVGRVPVEYLGTYMEKAIRDELNARHRIIEEKLHENNRGAEILRVRPEEAVKGSFVESDVYNLLPLSVRAAIAEGMLDFGKKIKGFDNDGVLLAGIESRTSSPVRIMRGEDYESIGIRGIYPCGEGAGYAGGIMSAATDGIKVAEAVIEKLSGI